MLIRELAARYLALGGTIRLDVDERLLTDIGRAGPVSHLDSGPEPGPGDVVILEVDPAADDLANRLGQVVASNVTVLLLLPRAAADLPVGRLVQAACVARLAFVELAPIEPGGMVRTVVVCRPSSRPVAVRAYLGDDPAGTVSDIDLDRQGLRIVWEWGLSDARARAVQERDRAARARVGELEQELTAVRRDGEQELATVRHGLEEELATVRSELEHKLASVSGGLEQELATARRDLQVAREAAQRSESRAVAEAARRGALQQSQSFLVGQAILTTRRHPVRGIRRLLGAIARIAGR